MGRGVIDSKQLPKKKKAHGNNESYIYPMLIGADEGPKNGFQIRPAQWEKGFKFSFEGEWSTGDSIKGEKKEWKNIDVVYLYISILRKRSIHAQN